MIVWLPVGYTGLPRTQEFSTHTIHLIDAGIVSYQPWTDQNGAIHPFREYGGANLQWNTSNVVDGYQVESYNFSNVPNVVGIDWDFHTLIAKAQNGVPVYEDVFPNLNGPVFPFEGTNFQMTFQSFKSYHAQWPGNATVYYSDLMGNITGSPPTWPDADHGMRSQIETDVTQILQQLPKTVPVALNFTANWYMRGIISSPDAGLEYYNMGFDRAASVSMVVENGTALTAAGSFYVQTSDGAQTQITYRTVSLATALYTTIAIAISVSIVSLVLFGRELAKKMRSFRLQKQSSGPGNLSWLAASSSLIYPCRM